MGECDLGRLRQVGQAEGEGFGGGIEGGLREVFGCGRG